MNKEKKEYDYDENEALEPLEIINLEGGNLDEANFD